MIVSPGHEFVAADQELADRGMQLFETLLPLSANGGLHRLHSVVEELRRRAVGAVDDFAHDRDRDVAVAVTPGLDALADFDGDMDESFDFFGGELDGPFML